MRRAAKGLKKQKQMLRFPVKYAGQALSMTRFFRGITFLLFDYEMRILFRSIIIHRYY